MKASNLRKGDTISIRAHVRERSSSGVWISPHGELVWIPEDAILEVLDYGDQPEIGAIAEVIVGDPGTRWGIVERVQNGSWTELYSGGTYTWQDLRAKGKVYLLRREPVN